MRTVRLAAFTLLVLVIAGSSSSSAQVGTDRDPTLRISMAEFKRMHAAGQVVVVDVRAPESYAEGHIPGALSVPLEDLQAHLPRLQGLKKPIVTYCA